MSVSETQICNLALLNFGEKTITSTNDNTKEGRACKVLYPIARDALLYSHPWNFAMRRADISGSVVDEPAFGYEYAYQLPPQCLRVWELFDQYSDATSSRVWLSAANLDKTSVVSEDLWEVEGQYLLTDRSEEIYIRYIQQITETGYFTPAFVECLGLLLGSYLAPKLSSGSKKRELIEELEKISLPRAHRLNALEGNKRRHRDQQPLDEGNFSWQGR